MRVIPKILIIDDDAFFLEFYRAELSQYNFYTDFARDGLEGLNKAKEIKPDLILLDVILPKLDGFEVLAKLKASKETRDIPVVVTSSLSTESDIKKLEKLGAVKCFNKLRVLPKDVAIYLQDFIRSPDKFVETPQPKQPHQLSKEKMVKILENGLGEIENSLGRLFDKKVDFQDMDASLASFGDFQKHIEELSKAAGTIFIYSNIKAEEPGVAILSMKRDDTMALIQLIEQGTAGKSLGLTMSDQVVEEFFNIVINSSLTKLSSSVKGSLLLGPPMITNSKSIGKIIDEMKTIKKNDALVIFMEQSYNIEELGLSFSFFISFGSGIFKQK
jgi:twitching motility two-component system response regulator PilH